MEHQIDGFIKGALTRRSSVAHIQGPHGSGKSTKAIPHIWRAVQNNASVSMVYIQPTNAQACLFDRFLRSSNDTAMTSGLDAKRLRLWSFEDALPEILGPTETLYGSVVVCLDLDVIRTAYGEFLLACFVERVMQVHHAEDRAGCLVLLTLGIMEHRYPINLEPFTNPVVFHFATSRPAPQPRHLESLQGNTILKIMLDMADTGGVMLAFSGLAEFRFGIMEAVTSYQRATTACPIEVYGLSAAKLRDGTFVEWMDSFKGCALIMVDESVNVCLPLGKVHAVLYSSDRLRSILDSYTGLFLRREAPSSEPEVAVYQGYAVPNPSIPNPQLFVVGPDPQSSAAVASHAYLYGAELLVLTLLAFQKWRVPVGEMPLAHLGASDKTKWLEASGLLRAMGLLVEDDKSPSGWRVSLLGESAIAWLPYTSNWRVAFLLSHVQRNSSDLEKRVVIRLAAIIEFDVPFKPISPMTRKAMQDLEAAACGPAAAMVSFGQLWVTLSVWEAMRRLTNNFADISTRGILSVGGLPHKLGTLTHGYNIYRRVMALEKMVHLAPETAADMGMKLDATQSMRVQLALADVWLSNLFWVPEGWNQTGDDITLARCFAHSDDILIDVTTESIVMDGLLNGHGLYGMALDITHGNEGLRAWNTVLLHGSCLNVIHRRMGSDSDFRSAFSSLYAHRGRNE